MMPSGAQGPGRLSPEWLLWGKTEQHGPVETRKVHPLLCHMLDVAAVARALWDEVLAPAARRHLATDLGLREDQVAAGRWVGFFAGLHDVGKAAPTFQVKHEPAYVLLRNGGLPCPSQPPAVPHGVITARALEDALEGLGLDTRLISTLATALGGHHGVFPKSWDVEQVTGAAIGRQPWEQARRLLVTRLAEATGVKDLEQPRSISMPTAMTLAGLVSVADWIGSDERFFHYVQARAGAPVGVDAAGYWRSIAQVQAGRALKALRWTGWAPTAEALSFAHLFPSVPIPNAAQRAIIELAPSIEGQPGLVILEAPMGQGKTEAAMYLADRWGAALGQRGCYFALPTMATSNQMFGRVRVFLEHRYTRDIVNLQLLHGHAALSAELEILREHDRLLRPQNVYDDHGMNSAAAGVVAAEWFLARKRGLLAPFGVGTVDQGLLAVLQTRHVFVRLFGLAHKVVVIDEVHAYDTYMTTLLERLLSWLAALRTSVVLLSATLPRQRRAQLAAAFARGLKVPEPTPEEARYPRLTWVSAAGSGARGIEDTQSEQRMVGLEWVDGRVPDLPGDPFDLGRRLKQALTHGGCAAVICNTVGRAQRVYQALRPYFVGTADDGLPRLDLFHAQYLYRDRETRERHTLLRFGKEGANVEIRRASADDDPSLAPAEWRSLVRRPDRAVLVATQVIEQSLDLDFDLMVTDLAPSDLMLQRSGRLHRHRRDQRPPGLETPVLWVCLPETWDRDVPGFGRANEYIYAPHILLRSWLDLRARQSIAVPGEVEALIEAVYEDSYPCPGGASVALQAKWHTTRQQLEEAVTAERGEAEKRWLKGPDYRGELWRLTADPREEDAPDFHEAFQALTRLARPTVQVVCLYGAGDGHPAMSPDGRERINPSTTPGIVQSLRLLRNSSTISDGRVVHTLLAQPVPSGWRESALLRHYRLIILDLSGNATMGNYQFHIDDTLGVTITPSEGST